MTISHLSMRAISMLKYGDWLERDVFKLGNMQYRVTGYDQQTKALRVEPVNDPSPMPSMHSES